MTDPLYLDYNATTPVAPEVADAMVPCLREHFGNPSSSHVFGRRAHDAVEQGRARVAALIGARPEEVVFTGCATEANNLAILGAARILQERGRHLITSAVEHPSLAQPAAHLRAVRLTIGEPTTDDEIGEAAAALAAAWHALRPQG